MSVSTLTNHNLTISNSQAFNQGALQSRLYLPSTKHRGLALGYIGNLDQDAQGAGEVSANERADFLQCAKNKLLSMGAQKIIGPIDGDTWRRYRLSLPGSAPLNFLEPAYPAFVPGDFIAADMPVVATYRTTLVSDLSLAMEKLAEMESLDQKTLAHVGVKVRCIRPDDFEYELGLLHQFSLTAFEHNFLYNPIDLASFQTLYRPLKGLLRGELVLIAESDDSYRTVLGVVLALPDPANISSIIVKTLARHPTAPRGMGRYLFYEVLARAHQLGYRQAECALIKDNNFSAFLPDQLEGTVIRKFALFGSSQ
jgi:hypothetical protein